MLGSRRQMMLAGLVVVGLSIAAIWHVAWMLEHRGTAQRAANNLADCKLLAEQIVELRTRPAVAADEEMGIQELDDRIEYAKGQARLTNQTRDVIDIVDPQPARRIGNSPYLQKPTMFALRDVSLPQLTAFLYHLTDGSGLTVRSLRLRVPTGEATADRWDVETTLTYLIYAPPESLRRGD